MNKIKFKLHNSIGQEELVAASKVIKSGNLSGFYAQNIEKFFGGKKVLEFEKKIKKFFNVKYAIVVNSWTSGLITAIGSLDIKPGDEIILPPFTMSACAISVLHWNAIPIFADVDENTFCITPETVEKKITKKTKAIMLVDINGYPSEINGFKKIAKKYKLKIIIDSAQSLGAKYLKTKKFTGTVGDVGGFSLNIHKHINTGEGGIIVTNNKSIALKSQLIRNHGENIVEKLRLKNLYNIIGYNFRMGEIEAAIGIEQLKKLPKILKKIQNNAKILNDNLKNLQGLIVPEIDNKLITHSYYTYGLRLNLNEIKISRKKIVQMLNKKGVPCGEGYLNLHLLPLFTKKIAYALKGFPWNLNKNKKYIYKKVDLKVAEDLHFKSYLSIGLTHYDFSKKDIQFIISCFKEVWKNLGLKIVNDNRR
jgi:perosamine synthetase